MKTPSHRALLNGTEFLRWIAGSGPAPHDVGAAEGLEAFVERHRIVGRLIRQIERDEPRWATSAVREHLKGHQSHTERIVQQQLTVARRVIEIAGPEELPIVLKGVSPVVHLSDRTLLRRSADVDVISTNADRLSTSLRRAGFVDGGAICAPHEAANLIADGVEVDVHRHSILCAYPPDAYSTRSSSAGQGTQQFRVGRLVERRILPERLAGDAVAPELGFGRGLRVPSATWSVVIACASLFKDGNWEPYAVSSNNRFATFLEIYELVGCSSFDSALFDDIVAELDAFDSVRFVSRVLARYFPCDPFSRYHSDAAPALQKLANAWFGPWVPASPDLDFFGQTGRELIGTLVPIDILLGGDRSSVSSAVDRTHVWSEGDGRLDVVARIMRLGPNLRVVVRVAGAPSDGTSVMVNFAEGGFSDWVFDSRSGPVCYGEPVGSYASCADGYEVTFDFQARSARSGLEDGEPLPAVVCVVDRAHGSWSSIVFPLRILGGLG